MRVSPFARGPFRSPASLLWDVVDESCDEAEFLWRSWELGLNTHAHDLRGHWLWTEDRLQGALDGARLGGERIIEGRLVAMLESDEAFACAAAAHVLLSLGPEAHVRLSRAFAAFPANRKWLRRGIEVATAPRLRAHVESFLVAHDDEGLTMAVRSFRGEASAARTVVDAARAAEADDRAAAMGAALALPAMEARKVLAVGLSDAEPLVVAAAVQTGLILGLPGAWDQCVALAKRGTCPDAFAWAACLGGLASERLLEAGLSEAHTSAHALAALGFLGTRTAADLAMEAMHAQSDTNVRLAAESFAAATGIDLKEQGLAAAEAPWPDDPVPFEHDDLHADLVPKPDDLLPWPDVGAIARWWQAERPRFEPGQRYVAGRPLCAASLYEALCAGPMRRRHVMAFELAARTQGLCHVQTRAFHELQRQQLAHVGGHLSQRTVAFVGANVTG